MAITGQGKCIITELSDSGLGVSSISSGGVKLPYTLPGEEVSFEKHEYRGHVNYLLRDFLSRSERRAKPDCRYFETCGGCLLQHLNPEDYISFKLKLIERPLREAGINLKLNPIIIIPKSQRRKAVFEAMRKGNEIFLGFRRFQSHQIINIDECIALVPELSELIPKIKTILPMILAEKEKVKIFANFASNGIDLILEVSQLKDFSQNDKKLLQKFAEDNSVVRLVVIGNSVWNVIHQREYPYIKFDDIAVETDANSFLQVSFAADQILADLVVNGLLGDGSRVTNILDLFSGRGTFSLPLSKFANIDSFELDSLAVKALKSAAKKSGRQIDVIKRDLFQNPLKWDELNKYDMAALNPPRSGAEKQCVNLSLSTLKKICYVSCNPESFVRDVKILLKAGWVLNSVTPVDQFYQTPHLEVVCILSK